MVISFGLALSSCALSNSASEFEQAAVVAAGTVDITTVEVPVISTTTTVDVRSQWDIPILQAIETVSDRPYFNLVELGGVGYGLTELVTGESRLDRVSLADGAVSASIPIGSTTGGPFQFLIFQTVWDQLILTNADHSLLQLIDPESLSLASEIWLPPNARVVRINEAAEEGMIWLASKAYDTNIRQGISDDRAALKLDLATGQITERREVPGGGANSALTLPDGSVLVGVEGLNQLLRLDSASYKSDLFAAFPRGGTIRQVGDYVIGIWSQLGVVALIDPATIDLTAIDLNFEGPSLFSATRQVILAGDIWLIGQPANLAIGSVLFRIDPVDMAIVARAFIPTSNNVLAVDGSLILAGSSGLFRVDPSSVVGGAPSTVERPELPEVREAIPENETDVEIIAAFNLVWDITQPTTPEVLALLAEPGEAVPLRDAIVERGAALFPGVVPVIMAVTVEPDRASFAYSFLLNDVPVGFSLTGTFINRGGDWKLTTDSLCLLATELALDCP